MITKLLKLMTVVVLICGFNLTAKSQTTLLSESFDGGVLPTGWTTAYVVGSTNWIFNAVGGYSSYPATTHSGAYNARFYYNSYGAKTELITPVLDFSGLGNAQLTFWHAQDDWGGDQDSLTIFYRSSGTSPWVRIAQYTANITTWTQEIVALPSVSSTSQIKFRGCGEYGYGVVLDDVMVTGTAAGPTTPVTVTIGTGTSTCTYPYTTYWHDGRTQMLMTKSEIEAAGGFAGIIENLQFNVASVNTSLQTLNGFEIKMQNYTGSSLSSFVTSGWTTVYSGTELITATGWNNKDFQIPFLWNGSDNLLVEVCYDNTFYTSYSYVYGSSVSNLAYYYNTDGASGCSMTGGSAQSYRPNMRFTITPLIESELEGVVTNAITGLPIIGALVTVGDSSTYTNLDGSYFLNCYGGDVEIVCGKLGYNTEIITTNLVSGSNTQDFALFDNTAPPSVVYASLNSAQTVADITWGLPMSGYVIIYDDGEADNLVSWATAGNINAVKFTPIEQYPVTITGGSVYIGDGSYPVGGNVLSTFEIAVYDDDGPLGYPNTELVKFEVTPTNYYWVHFDLPAPVTITSGKFYIGMIQGGAYPNCAPIGVDEDPPLQMVSYSKYETGSGPWVPAGYNDFMIRAEVYGSGGPLDVSKSTDNPIMIAKTRIHPASKFLNQPKVVGGLEGIPSYIPLEKSQVSLKAKIAPAPAVSNMILRTPVAGSDDKCDQPYTGILPFTGVIPASNADGVLFDNGQMVNSPGTGLSGMDESVIEAPIASYGFNFNNALGYTVAEDFTVTGSVPWAITSVEVFGYQTGQTYNGASTFTSAFVRIWDGNPSVSGSQVIWGDLTTNRLSSSTFTDVFRVNAVGASTAAAGQTRPIFRNVLNTAGLTLDPGSYWIEFTTTGSLASGPWVVPLAINGQPVSGNALQYTGSWAPLVSPTGSTNYQGLPFVLNGNALGDLEYQVWRLKQGDENTPAVWTSLGVTSATSISDPAWATLPNGGYLWAVKAHYPGDRWSDAAFSNVLGKGMLSNVTVNVTLSSAAGVPSGVNITMSGTQFDSTYYDITPATGSVNFPTVWKDNYDISLVKFGYTSILDNVEVVNNTHVFNYILMETQWAPYNLYVDDRTLVAVWNAPNPMVALFEEHFTSGSYATNGWIVSGGNWGISTGIGAPAPSAIFNWSPQATNYSQTITTPDIVGVGSPGLFLKYDIYLDNYGTTNENQMAVEIWDGANWNRLKNYTNLNGSFDWDSESLNIAAYTWDTFKIRFQAYGVDSYDLNNWNIDNIVVAATLGDKSLLGYNLYLDDIQIAYTVDTTYLIPASVVTYGRTYTACVDAVYESGTSDRDCYTFTSHFLPKPENLTATPIQDAAFLDWDAPAAIPGGGTPADYILDDGSFENGWAINPGYSSWIGNEFATTDAGVLTSIDLYFMANSAAGSDQLTIDIFDENQVIVATSDPFTPVDDDFVTVTLDNIPFNGTFYAMVHWNMNAGSTNWLGLDENGPNAALDPEWYFDGTTWDKFSNMGYNGGVFGIRAHAMVGKSGKSAVYGTLSKVTPTSSPIAPLSLTAANRSAVASSNVQGNEINPSDASGPLGYDVYRDGVLIAYVEAPTTEYYDLYLNPAEYCYTVTAVYDLEPFGFPVGTTDESLEEGPACVNIQYGVPIPWEEEWNSTNFSYNNWSFEPNQGHWRISNATGNGVPSAEFNWAAPESDYSYALVSQALDASVFDCSVIMLDFDLKLEDRNITGAEKLTVDVYWDGIWHKVAEYKNEGSFDWETKSIDISATAAKAMKLRFVAHGDNTSDIIAWYIDNVNVYPIPNAATNLTGIEAVGPDAIEELTWNAVECATGPVGDLLMLSQHDGNPANGYYQSYGMAYGVVYDLAAYPDATLAKIDYHHASWGTTGVWQYNIHVVDWNTYTLIGTIGPLVTTGNDIWETDVMLGDIMGYGGGQVGIMLEPLSNDPADAYPDFSADNVGPDGASMYGTLPDFSGFGPSGIGDFLQNLWIYTAFGDGKVVAAPKVHVNQMSQQAVARVATTPMINREYLTINQKSINYTPSDGGNRGVVGYNVYRKYSTETEWTLLNAVPVTDTTYTDNVPEFGEFCYVVKAVHAAFGNSTMESPASNEWCGWMMVGVGETGSQSIQVYPNPATDQLTVKTSIDIRRIELVNYLGQVVRNQDVEGIGSYTLNVSDLESGVYFVKFYAQDGSTSLERVTITR